MFEMPPDTPPALAKRPRTFNGYPIPWFAAKDAAGNLDIRVGSAAKMKIARTKDLCWVCGQPWGDSPVFVIGPMGAVNRTTMEPACCEPCARFSVKYCPFLTQPRMRRNEHDLPAGSKFSESGLKRNPGGVVLWPSYWDMFRAGGEMLVHLHEPYSPPEWFAKGQPLDRAGAQALIDDGAPAWMEIAEKEGPTAVAALQFYLQDVKRYLPAA